jgi:hypothetical protein
MNTLPAELRKRTSIVAKTLKFLSTPDVKNRLEPVLRAWEREYEAAVVDELISARRSQKAVTGIDQTLAQLQKGRVRALVIARGVTATLRECTKCGTVDRSADPTCANCGSERRPRTLRTVIPELASRQGVAVEVVSGGAARRLRAAGDMAAAVRGRKTELKDRTARPVKHPDSSPGSVLALSVWNEGCLIWVGGLRGCAGH